MNTKSKYFKKGIRIGMMVACIIFFLLSIGIFVLSRYIPNLLRNKINHMVVNGSDSLYKCSISKISINFWRGKVSIEDLNITVDSVKYREQKLDGRLPNITFELKMMEGSVNGLKVFPLIFSKKIIVESIQLDSANISMCRQHKEGKKKNQSENSLWKILKPRINGIYVNRVLLNKIKLSYRHSEDKKDIAFGYQDCSAELRNIRIDSIGAGNTSRILFTEDIAIKIAGMTYFTSDSLYNLKIDTLRYSSLSKRIQMRNFSLKPTMTPAAYTRKHGMQVDIFETYLPSLEAFNFKIEKIFTENEVGFDSVILKSPIVKIHRDRRAHFDTTSQLGKYPNEALAMAPFTLRLPILIIEDAEIHYVEIQKLTHKTGDAFFSHVTGTVMNITNHKDDIAIDNHCKMKLKGYFLRHGILKVALDFDLASTDGSYSASADLGSMAAGELNTIFIPFANVSLKTMDLDEGHLRFQGNSKGVTGSARILYKKLKIEILTVDDKTHKLKKRGFLSFIANLFAVRAHNKAGKNEVTADFIHVERKRRQPFGNLMWEFLFESVKKIVLKVPAKDLKCEM